MLNKLPLCLALATVLVARCSSGVVRTGNLIRAIRISFTPQAQQDLADNLKLSQNTLLDMIKRALQARNLLDASSPRASREIEVVMTSIRIPSSFNAFMFGFMAGADSLQGDVMVRDISSRELDRFSVYAGYALGGLAGANDDAGMGRLYEHFAQLTVQNLLGKTPPTAQQTTQR